MFIAGCHLSFALKGFLDGCRGQNWLLIKNNFYQARGSRVDTVAAQYAQPQGII